MAYKVFMFRLNEETLNKLDDYARSSGISRSAAARLLLASGMKLVQMEQKALEDATVALSRAFQSERMS